MREKSVALLNEAIAEELSAVHQYMYFHFQCDDQGCDLLAGLFKKVAIEEMIHIEKLAERALFLKGEIEMEASEKAQKINEVEKMLEFAVESEERAVVLYNQFANECSANTDSVSKKLFEELVGEEEGHFDRFDTEMDNLKKFGDRYLALQSIERSKASVMTDRNNA